MVCDLSGFYVLICFDECTWTMGVDEVCVSFVKRDDECFWCVFVGV